MGGCVILLACCLVPNHAAASFSYCVKSTSGSSHAMNQLVHGLRTCCPKSAHVAGISSTSLSQHIIKKGDSHRVQHTLGIYHHYVWMMRNSHLKALYLYLLL